MSAYESMTPAQLVALYNSRAEALGEKTVKRFSDRKTAERRLAGIEERFAESVVSSPFPVEAPVVETPVVVEAPVVPAAPVAAPKKSGGRGRKTSLNLDLVYSPLMDPMSPSNPKRKGTRAHKLFELYGLGMVGHKYVKLVVAQGYDRKLALDTLRWDLEHQLVVAGEKNEI